MAAPVIDSVSVVPPSVPPGGKADITIKAHDPDNKTVNISGTVTDSSGNETPFTATVAEGDPLTYSVTVDSGSVVQDAANPSVFHFQA